VGRVAAVLVVCAAAGYFTRGVWLHSIGRSLVCADDPRGEGEVLLIDNFDTDYLLFKRAAALQRGDIVKSVIVPVVSTNDPDAIAAGREVTLALAKLAGLANMRLLEIRQSEPISLNAAYQIRDALAGDGARSVTVITPGFRSRRSIMIYREVLEPRGVRVSCAPVWSTTTVENWSHTWHGIQDVGLQFLKLQYYRFWVLPRA
jgi:hypothetical protein